MNAMKKKLEEITEKSGIGKLFEHELPLLENAAGRVAEHIRQHPVPYALVGAGVALLAYRAFHHREREHGLVADLKREAKNGAGVVREKLVEPVTQAVDRLGARARETAEHFVDNAAKARDKTFDQTTRAGKSISDFVDRNPWAVGAGVVALRFVAGLVSRDEPRTHAKAPEPARSDLKKRLREVLLAALDGKA